MFDFVCMVLLIVLLFRDLHAIVPEFSISKFDDIDVAISDSQKIEIEFKIWKIYENLQFLFLEIFGKKQAVCKKRKKPLPVDS